MNSQDLTTLNLQRNPFNLQLPALLPDPTPIYPPHPTPFPAPLAGAGLGRQGAKGTPSPALPAFLPAPAAGGVSGQPPTRLQDTPRWSRASQRPAAAAASPGVDPRFLQRRPGTSADLARGPGPEALPRLRARVRCLAASGGAARAVPRAGSARDRGASSSPLPAGSAGPVDPSFLEATEPAPTAWHGPKPSRFLEYPQALKG